MDSDPGSITIDYHLCRTGYVLGGKPLSKYLEGYSYDNILATRRRTIGKKRY